MLESRFVCPSNVPHVHLAHVLNAKPRLLFEVARFFVPVHGQQTCLLTHVSPDSRVAMVCT